MPNQAVDQGIGRYVTAGARAHPDRPALEMWGGAVRTYAELESRSIRLANSFTGLGLRPGSRIAIWLDNCLEYLDVYIAAAKAGFVVVPVNARFTAAEARQVLADADVEILVHGSETADRIEALGVGRELRAVVHVGGSVCASHGLEDLVAAGRPSAPQSPTADAPLIIGYTSGTTGVPRGAVITHRSAEHVGLTNAVSCRYRLGGVHVFGMSLSFTATVPAHVLPHLFVGGTTVLHRGWDAEALVDCVEARRGTFMIVPSPALREMAAQFSGRPGAGRSLTGVLHSASKAPAGDLGALVDALGEAVIEGWGMTENSGGLFTASHAGDLTSRRADLLAGAGRPVPGTAIRVVEDGLEVRAASLFSGYWRNETATAEAFSDGWFRTGDLGEISPEGVVTISDRRADLINSGGMNVYPSEVERVLLDSGVVAECAVVAAPHERWGQVPVAFLVPNTDRRPDDLDEWLSGHLRSRLAGYKRPARLEWLTSLPRNTGGKIERRRLAELAATPPGSDN